ncbi:hypothetical protein ABBQ32_011655 [Trebouxia sp. C0010 RCD-2024]
MHQFAVWVLWPLLAFHASAQLQCPTGLPGGSKYLLCLAGSSTPPAQPDPYPVRLGQPGVDFLQNYAGISGATAVRLFRRQALDFFFTYFHLNYEESLIPPGKTVQELAAVAPGPKNSQGKFLWNMQAYALDPAGDLPSLQRLCNSFGCADMSPGQIPVYIGGYQLQIQQPFTARSGTKYNTGDMLMYGLASINTTLLNSINAQRDNGGKEAKAGMLIPAPHDESKFGGHTLIYVQSKPGTEVSVTRKYQDGQLVISETAQMQAQSQLFGSGGYTQLYYYVRNPLASSGSGAINAPSFETVTIQEVLHFS